MELVDWIAQGIGIVAMAANILSFQQKTRMKAIACQLVGGALFAVNFFMMGAIVGGILNAVAFVRAIIFLNKERLRADKPVWLVGFTAVYLLSYVLTFTLFGKAPTAVNLLIEFLPVVGMISTTLGFRLTDAKAIRRFGLISSPCWLIYNIANLAVGAICCEVLSLCSIVIGMVRLDRKGRVRCE